MIHTRMRDGTRIAYERFGLDEGPVALLLDGISCDGFIWHFLRPWLAERFQVIHMHHRGHGQSGLPRDLERMTVGNLAEDVSEILELLDLSEVLVFGHSMGVQVTLEVAARHPERIQAGVLLCGASGRLLDTFKDSDLGMKLMPPITVIMKRYRGLISRFLRVMMPTTFATLVAGFTEPNRRLINPAHLRPYMAHLGTMQPDVVVRLLNDASRRSGTHLLSRIQQPMLVIAGEADGFTPARVSEAMATDLPRGRYVSLAEGSHTAPLELPQETQSAVSDFIDDLTYGGAVATAGASSNLAAQFRARAQA